MKATPRCSASRPDLAKPDIRETQLMIEASESRKRELLTRLLEIDKAMASVAPGSGTQPHDLDAQRLLPTAVTFPRSEGGGPARDRMSRAASHMNETFAIALEGLQAELENVRKCKGTLSSSEAQSSAWVEDTAGMPAAKPVSSEEERQVLILRQMQQLLSRSRAAAPCASAR